MGHHLACRTAVVVVLILLGMTVHGAAHQVDYADMMRPHPRLLLPAGEETVIKAAMAAEPALGTVHKRIMVECDRTLAAEPVKRIKEGKRLLAVSREALKRIYYLSYAWRMTGNDAYAVRAEQEMLAVSAFRDWNPSHFLDVGEMVMALALGYDWLYGWLSEQTRHTVRRAIMEKGFDAAGDKGRAWFYDSPTNWNSVCNAGLLYGALAIYDEEPERSRRIIDKCLLTNPKAMACYGPDGGYPEGFMYWGYGTGFQVMLIAALESALGSDFGLTAAPGFLESARFMQYMSAPSGCCFNFSDARAVPEANMMLYWFARKLDDRSVVYLERKYLASDTTRYAEPRLLPSLMVFASQAGLAHVRAPQSGFWFNRGATPVFVYRGGWDSAYDTYLGVKGGTASTSHAHMDAGSFVYERNGVRWAMDLGMQEYITLEREGVDLWNQRQDGQRWDVFRIGNAAHNTLTVNGGRHLVKARAEITDTLCGPARKGAVVDLSATLAGGLKAAVRTVELDGEDNLTVTDSLTAPDTADAEVMWVMVTPADVRIVDWRTVELSREGRRMYMSVDEAGGVSAMGISVLDNDPPHAYDVPNPGTRRVCITLRLEAGSEARLRVRLAET